MSSSSAASSSTNNGEKWDHSVENLVRKSTIGFAAGLLPSLLFPKVSTRFMVIFGATGFGAGVAYAEACYLFDKNVMFERRHDVTTIAHSTSQSA